MGIEIERKFLLSAEPAWLADCRCSLIDQGYLALDDQTEVRVRRDGGRGTLTVKRGQGVRRGEVEVELEPAEVERLWPLTAGRRVRKRRYLVPLDIGTAEVDIYEGPHAGLITAEVEFADEDAAERAELPSWLGREVTGEERYANRALAVAGRPPD